MSKSKISWTQKTWNPTTGCSKISTGCLNCYAEKMHNRLRLMGCEKYNHPFNVIRFHPEALQIPYKTKKPTVFFVNSMSDLFHSDGVIEASVNDEAYNETHHNISQVFNVIHKCPHHIFQILTKRPEYIQDHWEYKEIMAENIWLGVTVEQDPFTYRIKELSLVLAPHKFISFEPLLSYIEFPSSSYFRDHGISWVIVGGETGPAAREMKEKWVVNIKEQCRKENIPFFFKQWGKGRKGNLLQGKIYEELPEDIEKIMRGGKR